MRVGLSAESSWSVYVCPVNALPQSTEDCKSVPLQSVFNQASHALDIRNRRRIVDRDGEETRVAYYCQIRTELQQGIIQIPVPLEGSSSLMIRSMILLVLLISSNRYLVPVLESQKRFVRRIQIEDTDF